MSVKPIINNMTPWDATLPYTINFSYSGGLPVSNRIIIQNAGTLAVVYDNVAYTPGFSHDIPANTLANGHKYTAQLIVTSSGETSPISDKVYFWCFTTPEFYYTEPTENANIKYSWVNLVLHYYQENGESLYSYRHILYDNSKIELTSTDMFYTEDNLEYTFKGLNNHSTYYLQSVGVTKNGIVLDTGMRKIFTNYANPADFQVMNVESDDNATVTGYTNMISIDADENAEDYVFLGSYVQILNNEVNYTRHFNIEGDFSCSIKVTKLYRETTLLTMNNDYHTLKVNSYILDDDSIVYRLIVNNGLTDYNLFSPPMFLNDDDVIVICITRKKDAYKLTVTQIN